MSHDATRALILHEQRHVDAFVHKQVVDVPPATRAAMIAPHPDDNILGPGGVTLKYVARGVPVTWVCLSDGRACIAGTRAEREAMARTREQEEKECARQAGVTDMVWVGHPEDRLTEPDARDTLVSTLNRSLLQAKPDALFVPWYLETHPLHRYTCALVARALPDDVSGVTVYSYAVISFPPPRLLVDISQEFARKRELTEVHASQLKFRDYAGELEVLNSWQAGFAGPPTTHAEVFFPMPADEWAQEIRDRHLDDAATLGTGAQPVLPEQPDEGSGDST